MLPHRYWVVSYMRDDARSFLFICLRQFIFMYTDPQFLSFNVAARAESVGGSTPGVRVTWNTTLPPDCVASVRVNFQTTPTSGLAAANTTTNASQTEIIQNGLQCGTNYYIRVLVSGKPRHQGVPIDQFLLSNCNQVQVIFGGNKVVCMTFLSQKPDGSYFIAHAAIPIPFGVRAEVTADNTSVRVSWEWSCQGVLDFARVYYQPEGGSDRMYTVNSTTATSATLPSLQCNTEYTVWVHASGGLNNLRSLPILVNLPARGSYQVYIV